MRLCFTLFLALILPAATAMGANEFSRKQVAGATGVQVDGSGTTVPLAEGQSVAGKIGNTGPLSKRGLKGVKPGDSVKLTRQGSGVKLTHVPSGQECNFGAKKQGAGWVVMGGGAGMDDPIGNRKGISDPVGGRKGYSDPIGDRKAYGDPIGNRGRVKK